TTRKKRHSTPRRWSRPSTVGTARSVARRWTNDIGRRTRRRNSGSGGCMTGSPLGATDAPAESRRSGTFETLSLRGVGRTFGKTAALKGLDLEIRRGEFIALLGPSGCGKSTALNCLAGLLPLTSGSIWQDETRIDVLPPERRGFGMVFQNYALFPHMSVRKNV